MSVIYKILCEVKWMHEYYCSTDKGDTVFDLPAQSDRIQFLLQQFIKDLPSINRDLDFVFPATSSDLFNSQHIKIIPAYSGFKLAVKCRKQLLADGTIVYSPLVSLPNSTQITIFARIKNNINGFTHNSLLQPFSAIRYFSNEDIPLTKTFPFLTEPVPAYNAALSYEQGALASYGANDVRCFLNNGAVNAWLSLNGTGYSNEGDKLLLPLGFGYAFAVGDNVTDAQFILKDASATTIKQIKFSGTEPLRSVFLNFQTDQQLVRTVPENPVSASTMYSLTVTGSNGYAKSFSSLVFADPSMDIVNNAAYFQLKVQPGNPAFNLLDNNGFLQTRIMPDSSRVPPPVFELWMKSRLVFWQYKNNRQQKIKTTLSTQPLLSDNSGILVTKNPLFLSHSPRMIKKPDNSFMYLPNPVPGDTVQINGNTFLMNIQVPISNLFPLA
jgi:hypothetical protein